VLQDENARRNHNVQGKLGIGNERAQEEEGESGRGKYLADSRTSSHSLDVSSGNCGTSSNRLAIMELFSVGRKKNVIQLIFFQVMLKALMIKYPVT
jgi:hypothetical protein